MQVNQSKLQVTQIKTSPAQAKAIHQEARQIARVVPKLN